MADTERRRKLDARLHDLRWKLVTGSGVAFTGIWLLIAAQTAAASNPTQAQATAPDGTATPAQLDPLTTPALAAPQPAAPQISNANPSYPPLVKTRRS